MNNSKSTSMTENEINLNQEAEHIDLSENVLEMIKEDFSMDGQLIQSNSYEENGLSNIQENFKPDESKYQAHKEHYENFLREMEKISDVDGKLQFAIDFMEASFAQSGTPHFKSFWEARNVCLQLFKENISPGLRSILWIKYNELSKEARRLKEILDEQSAFAVEQIEIAVKALENDIVSFDEHLKKIQAVEFETASHALANRLPFYQQLQKELNLLNTQAARINALRKELIRTEMRVRQKNKFFQRLSISGDQVFPRRKELIKEISQSFIQDVDSFISAYFANEEFQESLFSLREEIKALQNIAKVLTLNTHSFTYTRMRLSTCWDQIKNAEKERKKERVHQKLIYKQNYDEAFKRIDEFKTAYTNQPLSSNESLKQLDEISNYIRTLQLGRDEIRSLKEAFNNARQPILDKQQSEENQRQFQEQEKDKHRRNKITEIRNDIEEFVQSNQGYDADELTAKRDAILEKMTTISLSKIEKQEIERLLKPLRDIISERKESSLLKLSEDDRQSLQQLKEVLKQRKERRKEIKSQIDSFRKTGGSSGFNMVQAMNFESQLGVEKERLEKINLGINEIEKKISELEKR